MTEFKASNGFSVWEGAPAGAVVAWKDGTRSSYLAPDLALAMREFFRHETDEVLGRWRDPVKADRYVTVEREHPTRRIRVYDEMRNVYSSYVGVGQHLRRVTDGDFALADTAIRWADSHPEPKPWHGAKPGDHWALNIGPGVPHLFKLTRWMDREGWYFVPTDGGTVFAPNAPEITAGRRIWPEAD